jgi:hypothetical protein
MLMYRINLIKKLLIKDGVIKMENKEDDCLKHIGIMGMRWGTRKSQKKTDKLTKSVDRSIHKFDAGRRGVTAGTFREKSRKVRKETYKTNKRIARMNSYLNRTKDESVNNKIFKFKKDPQKIAKVKDYLARNQITTKRLSEVRTSLIDIKIDTL